MTVRDEATVTVSEAVNGLPQRVGRGAGKRPNSSRVSSTTIDPVLWGTMRGLLRPGERIVVVDDRTLRTTYR